MLFGILLSSILLCLPFFVSGMPPVDAVAKMGLGSPTKLASAEPRSPQCVFNMNFATVGSIAVGSPPKMHSTEALKQRKNSLTNMRAITTEARADTVQTVLSHLSNTTLEQQIMPPTDDDFIVSFADYWDAVVQHQVARNNGNAKTQLQLENGATAQEFTGIDVPSQTIARILLRVLQAMQVRASVLSNVLTPDHFAVVRQQRAVPWTARELSGDVHVAYNDRAEHVDDPRQRALPPNRRKPITWLRELLYMSPQQIAMEHDGLADPDTVWFIGALLCRMLFNKYPLDGWAPLVQALGRARGFEPAVPRPQWHYTPLNDASGRMKAALALVEQDQEWVHNIRKTVPEVITDDKNVPISFLDNNLADPKLVELAKKCLQTFPADRMPIRDLQMALEKMAN